MKTKTVKVCCKELPPTQKFTKDPNHKNGIKYNKEPIIYTQHFTEHLQGFSRKDIGLHLGDFVIGTHG